MKKTRYGNSTNTSSRPHCLAAVALAMVLMVATAPVAFGQAPAHEVPTQSEGATVNSDNGGLLCALCTVENTTNAIDGDPTSYARMYVPLGLFSGPSISVTFPNVQDAGRVAGAVLEKTGGLIDFEYLSSTTVSTYLDGTLQEQVSSSSLFVVRLLDTGEKYAIAFRTTEPFDEVEVAIGGLKNELMELRVYSTFSRGFAINEILAAPANGASGDANNDGVSSSSEDEFIELANLSTTEDIDLSGYTLSDASGVVHTFPSGTTLEPGEIITVFGGGTPTGISDVVQTASSGSLNLGDGGDDVVVSLGGTASLVAKSLGYGTEGSLPSPEGESIARDPQFIGAFVPHTDINGELYGPGLAEGSAPESDPDVATAYEVPTTEDGGVDANSGETGLCGNCQVVDLGNLIDPELSNFATMEIPLGLLGNAFVEVTFSEVQDAGRIVGFSIDPNEDLLSTGLLTGATLTTYLNGEEQESFSDTGLFYIRLLAAGGKFDVFARTSQPFDEVRLAYGGGLSVLIDVDIYRAFSKGLVVNEFLSDPVGAGDANGDGAVESGNDEFIALVNISNSDSIDLSGVTVTDNQAIRHIFPAGTVLPPGDAVTIYGGGAPANFPGLVVTASSGTLGLNNSEDSIAVRTGGAQNLAVASLRYGGADELPAPTNESLARAPCFSGPFTLHTNINGQPFSVGTCEGAGALPVQLAAFKIKADGRDVVLSWTTAVEKNTSYFQVQKQLESDAWVTVKGTRIESKAEDKTSTAFHTYQAAVKGVAPGTHAYRLKVVDVDGTASFSRPQDVSVALEGRFELTGAYPNPFHQQARFELYVKERQHVTVALYNTLGQRVRVLYEGQVAPGAGARISIDASGLASGLYFYRAEGETFAATKRVVLVH